MAEPRSTGAEEEEVSLLIARRWCEQKGRGWEVLDQTGRGGTAPVYAVSSPEGERALKIYDETFSTGDKGAIEEKRLAPQLLVGQHDCPSLVQIFAGGKFDGRLYVLMSRAPGQELAKRLSAFPRAKIREIVDQVARAVLFLRGRGLCHRDIKAPNIFVTDDFSHATVLDLSVMRGIHDPVGVGTDTNDQLPIVATARYSPPEYLFRLLGHGPEAWHALDVYQLGGVLHDLIMREPLFQVEYTRSKNNRYRFAWVVATIDPDLGADDVDPDLLFLARRALDKNWERRSTLRIEDFLADANSRRENALRFIGVRSGVAIDTAMPRAIKEHRMTEVAHEVERNIAAHLRRDGITSEHAVDRGADTAATLTFNWANPSTVQHGASDATLRFELLLVDGTAGLVFHCKGRLTATIGAESRTATLELPAVTDTPAAADHLGENCYSALTQLAIDVTKTPYSNKDHER